MSDPAKSDERRSRVLLVHIPLYTLFLFVEYTVFYIQGARGTFWLSPLMTIWSVVLSVHVVWFFYKRWVAWIIECELERRGLAEPAAPAKTKRKRPPQPEVRLAANADVLYDDEGFADLDDLLKRKRLEE